MTTGKTTTLTRQTFVGKVMSLLFNMLSRLVITFLPRSKHLLIPWLQSPSAVILEPRKIKSATVCTVSPSICHEVMGLDAMILVFWILSFKPTFLLSSFTFIKRLFSSSSLSAIGWCHLHIWGSWYFSRQSWFQLVLPPAQHFSWCSLLPSNKWASLITQPSNCSNGKLRNSPWFSPFPCLLHLHPQSPELFHAGPLFLIQITTCFNYAQAC